MEEAALDRHLARRIAAKKARLDARRPLAPALQRRLDNDLRLLLTFHSNALEGNTLSLRETKLILDHGIVTGGKTLREHLAATNHAEAIGAMPWTTTETPAMSHRLQQLPVRTHPRLSCVINCITMQCAGVAVKCLNIFE